MKKFYYYSNSKLKFVEIKSFWAKFFGFLSGSTLLLTAIFLSGYFLISSLTDSYNSVSSLKNQNRLLKTKLVEVAGNYNSLRSSLDSLIKLNDQLRIVVNMEPISSDERLVGVGGDFDDNLINKMLNNKDDFNLANALNDIDEMTRKFEFEKVQYKNIENKFEENQQLFKHIPAIKPADGTFEYNSFGMRLHPILKVYKPHYGIDIVVDRGTPVYAPGDGKVEFVGRRGGYGLVVEIDHGFGYETVFAHLSKTLVKKGQIVSRGDLIAKSGNSGLSSGPHLHYEVHHNGERLNPVDFFFDDVNFFELKKEEHLAEAH